MATQYVVLIVANHGNLQQGLQALLTTFHDVQVLVANDMSSALDIVEKHRLSLLILDYDMNGDDVQEKMDLIKASWTNIHWIILVSDEQQRQQVQELEADVVLIKGFPADKLIRVIMELLFSKF